MATPIENTPVSNTTNSRSSDGNRSGHGQESDTHDIVKSKECESRQLLYPEKFGSCYKEEKLQIVGKRKLPPNRKITQKIPQSSVLSQIKDFLPELSKANKSMAHDLKSRPELAESLNIESVDDDDTQHIEMNLSLVPTAVLLSDSSENSSDDSSSDGELDPDGKSRCFDNSPSAETRFDGDRLKLPGFPKKSDKKNRKTLIEEIAKEEDCDEDFTNR